VFHRRVGNRLTGVAARKRRRRKEKEEEEETECTNQPEQRTKKGS